MLYISVQDFYEQVRGLSWLSREEEKALAEQMKNGDETAREKLIAGYMPMVASYVKRAPENIETLGLILHCHQTLEKAVDSFNFLQESETFAHRLGWYLRNTITKYLAEKGLENSCEISD